MSGLNLNPNPTVLVVQTGLFLTNLVIIKKLILDPYLKVSGKRAAMTSGSKDEAEKLTKENQATMESIDARLQKTLSEARDLRTQLRTDALAKRDTLVSGAETEAKSVVESARKTIESDLAEESKKVPQIVASLTEELFQRTIH